MEKCFLCGKTANEQCSDCADEIFYCSQEHLDVHRPSTTKNRKESNEWKNSQKLGICLPFRVDVHPVIGRRLLATRNIRPRELVLWDMAAMRAPVAKVEQQICLGCFRSGISLAPCGLCQMPLCSEENQGSCSLLGIQDHSDNECKIFSKTLRENQGCSGISPSLDIYASIAPLRLLLIKERNRDLWSRIWSLMDHNEERFSRIGESRSVFQSIIDFIRDECSLADKFTEEDVAKAIGIVMTNAYENSDDEMQARALYPTLSLVSHSCTSNMRHLIQPGRQVALVAQKSISKGEELTIRYTTIMQGHIKRRSTLMDTWFFMCTCPRCSDRTEFGTLTSALLCPSCKNSNSVLLPEDMTVLNSDWICTRQCGYRANAQDVGKKEDEWISKLNSCQSSEDFSAFLSNSELTATFHPRHFVIMTARRNLHSLRGEQEINEENELFNRKDVEDKMEFCRTFAKYLAKLDPAEEFASQFHNVYILELTKLELRKAKLDFECGQLDKSGFLTIVQETSRLRKKVLSKMVKPDVVLSLLKEY